jgi:hypothetical protein
VEGLGALKAESYFHPEIVGMIDHEDGPACEAGRPEMLNDPDGVFFATNPGNEHVVDGGRAERPGEGMQRACGENCDADRRQHLFGP